MKYCKEIENIEKEVRTKYKRLKCLASSFSCEPSVFAVGCKQNDDHSH